MGAMTAAACPRCGSTDPAVRRTYTDAESGQCFPCPNDEWHDRPTGADPTKCPTCGSDDPSVPQHRSDGVLTMCPDMWHAQPGRGGFGPTAPVDPVTEAKFAAIVGHDRPTGADPHAVLSKAFTQHGDNLGGEYARHAIAALTDAGYVIVAADSVAAASSEPLVDPSGPANGPDSSPDRGRSAVCHCGRSAVTTIAGRPWCGDDR